MAGIDTYRQRFPEESAGKSDEQLSNEVYNKFYTDKPREWFNKKFLGEAEVKEYKPTERDQVARFLLRTPEGREQFDTPESRGLGTKIVKGLVGSEGYGVTNPSLADFTPAGMVFSYDEMDRAFKEGDPVTGAVSALGLVPLAGRPVATAVQKFIPETRGLTFGATAAGREREAAGRVAKSAQEDYAARHAAQGNTIDPREVSPQMLENRAHMQGSAAQPEQDLKLLDMGGQATNREFGAAVRESPMAGEISKRQLEERFHGQTPRVVSFLERRFPGASQGEETLDAAREASKSPTSALYQKAYADGNRDIITPTLVNMVGDPTFNPIYKDAIAKYRLQQISQGGAGSAGNQPTLAFWDQVKRAMDRKVSGAMSTNKEEAMYWKGIRDQLVAELDKEVPSYAAARGAASVIFKAGDAFEAGQEVAKGTWTRYQIQQAMARMNPAERDLFQKGFLHDYINKSVKKVGDSQSVVKRLAQNPGEEEKLAAMMGPVWPEYRAMLDIEAVMEEANKATGGSITAQATSDLRKRAQKASLPTLVGAGIAGFGQDLESAIVAVATGAAIHGAQKAQTYIDEDIARRVTQKLLSSDPNVYHEGLRAVMAYQPLRANFAAAAARLAGVAGKGVATSYTTDAPKGKGGYVDVKTMEDVKKLAPGTWVRTPDGRVGKVKERGEVSTIPIRPDLPEMK